MSISPPSMLQRQRAPLPEGVRTGQVMLETKPLGAAAAQLRRERGGRVRAVSCLSRPASRLASINCGAHPAAHLPERSAALLVLGAGAALGLWGAGLEDGAPLLLGGQGHHLGVAGRHLHIGRAWSERAQKLEAPGLACFPVARAALQARSPPAPAVPGLMETQAHLLSLELASLHCLFAAISKPQRGCQQGKHARQLQASLAVPAQAGFSATTGWLCWQKAGTYTQVVDFMKLVHW